MKSKDRSSNSGGKRVWWRSRSAAALPRGPGSPLRSHITPPWSQVSVAHFCNGRVRCRSPRSFRCYEPGDSPENGIGDPGTPTSSSGKRGGPENGNGRSQGEGLAYEGAARPGRGRRRFRGGSHPRTACMRLLNASMHYHQVYGSPIIFDGSIKLPRDIDEKSFARSIELRIWEKFGKLSWRPFESEF